MKQKILKYWADFKKSDTFKKLDHFIKTFTLPGFEGIPFYNIIGFLIKETHKDDITTRANSMAFSFFISLFPFLIVVFAIASFIPQIDIQTIAKSALTGLMPYDAEQYILGLLADVFSRGRSDLISVGSILAIYFASNGMEAMMRGFDKTYQLTFKQINWVQRRLISIRLTISIILLLVLSSVLIFGSSFFINWLHNQNVLGNFSFVTYQVVRWITVFFIYYGIIAFLYHYGPQVKKKFSWFSPGTNVATILCLLLSIGFSYYVNKFADYNKFYGSLGSMVIIMLWIQFNCLILLAGFELNASIAVNRDLRLRKKKKTNKL